MRSLCFVRLIKLTLAFSLLQEPARAVEPAKQGASQRPKSATKSSRPPPAELSDEAELARVTSLYQAGKYEACAQALSTLLGASPAHPLTEARVIEEARIYQAACWIGAGKPDLADEPLRQAIRANPQMSGPDSLMFPPPVVERFIRVRETLLDELRAADTERIRKARELARQTERKVQQEQARVRRLELLAGRETVVYKNNRWFALAPFGIGQFQNRQKALGFLFLTTELALVSAAITSTVVVSHLNLESKKAGRLESPDEVNARLQDWHAVFVGSSYGFLAVAAAGMAQAQLSFVPEFREVRPRSLPATLRQSSAPRVTLRPELSSLGRGLQFGLSGSF